MTMLDRVAGAPITWGVDGSPGWGHLMQPDRVLSEMVQAGLRATELGPDGYLGATSDEVLARLDEHGLELVGGFVPAVLHRPDVLGDQLDFFTQSIKTIRAGGADIAVLGAASHLPGYEDQIHLSEQEWEDFLPALGRLQDIASEHDMTVATHPHWGMAVEDSDDVNHLLEHSQSAFCLDTGHLALAGVDMMAMIAAAGDRIHHVHLKDVDPTRAAAVRSGDQGFRDAVIDGLFTNLGDGDVDFPAIIGALEAGGFGGWYVLEQDFALSEEPADGEGPIVNALASMSYLKQLDEDPPIQGAIER